jgi:hypothetical protein
MESGKRNPLDAEPAANGNVRVVGERGEVLTADARDQASANGEQLYLSHFATCPSAPAFRKK